MENCDNEMRTKITREHDKFMQAAAVLAVEIPDFDVKVVLERSPTDIRSKPHIIVSLPESHANLRLGLAKTLSQLLGISFDTDTHFKDSVSTGLLLKGDTVVSVIQNAANQNIFAEFSIDALDRSTSAQDKTSAMETRHAGTDLAHTLRHKRVTPVSSFRG